MFKGSPTIQMLKWNKILDMFFGENYYEKKPENVIKAIGLCHDCDHPLAQWLSSMFRKFGDQLMYDEIKEVLMKVSFDARALFFLSRFEYPNYVNTFNLLEESLRLGFTYAKVTLIAFGERGYLKEGDIDDLLLVASDGDRMANLLLCRHYATRSTQYEDPSSANYQRDLCFRKFCIKLGCVRSMIDHYYYLTEFEHSNRLRGVLIGKAAQRNAFHLVRSLKCDYSTLTTESHQGSIEPNLDFVYGRYLKGHVNESSIYNFQKENEIINDRIIHLAQSLVDGYDKVLKESIKSIDAWSLCAKHYLGVCKDIRLLIARLLWYEAYEWTNSLEGL
jgi:hypothetical protein